jgi:AbrB family looped-hinge helix DNA binding protein
MTQKMGAKGQVVIPKDLREQANLGPGDDVAFERIDDGIVIRRTGDRPPLRGRFAKSGMAARLLEDRHREPR